MDHSAGLDETSIDNNRRISVLKARQATLRGQIDPLDVKLVSLESTLRKEEAEIAKLSVVESQHRATLADIQQTSKKRASAVSSLEKAIAQHETDVKKLEKSQGQLTTQIESLQQQLDTLTPQIVEEKHLKTLVKLQRKEEQATDLKVRAELQKRIQAATRDKQAAFGLRKMTLEQELENCRHQLAKLPGKIQHIQEKIGQASNKKEAVKSKPLQDAEGVKAQLVEVEAALKERKTSTVDLKRQIKSTRGELTSLTKERNDIKREIGTLRAGKAIYRQSTCCVMF